MINKSINEGIKDGQQKEGLTKRKADCRQSGEGNGNLIGKDILAPPAFGVPGF